MRLSARQWGAIGATAAALAGIAGYEGYRERSYDDGVGVQTVGFGTTRHADGRPVQNGDRTDPVRAVVALQADADRHARELAACIGDVPLTRGEWDAYVSLTYNIGPRAFCRSTLVRRLKETPPKYDAACAEILKWNRAGGQVMAGLTKRRQDEFKLCTEGRP